MSNTIITPNMGLIVPVVGVDPGPDWATNLNASLTAIDSHSHVPGQGVPITPGGININTDLPMNGNNLTLTRTVRFQSQGAPISSTAPNIECLYVVGSELYYNDGGGNQVKITSGGSVAGSTGTITGLPSGTASASFSGSTFTFQSATSTPASMNFGPTTIGQAVASGFGVTISASNSQSSNYNLTLPTALPASIKILTVDNAGSIGDAYDVDNTTLSVSSNLLQVKDGGVTQPKLGPSNFNLSSSSGSFTTTSSSYVTVTGLVASINTTGTRIVLLQVVNASSSTTGGISASGVTDFRCVSNAAGTLGAYQFVDVDVGTLPVFVDTSPSPGAQTYTIQVKTTGSVDVDNLKLLALEQ